MGRFRGIDDYQHQRSLRTGILLVNLGTPDSPSTRDVRRYLKVFLSDPRVVEIPRLLWWLLLNGLILPFRAKKSAKLYQKVWTTEGSPLRYHSVSIGDKLQQELPENAVVAVAMSYGQPDLVSAMRQLSQQQIKQLIVVPLYPQYSSTTSGAVFDAISRELQSWRFVPQLHFVNTYHDHNAYIQAHIQQIKQHFANKHQPDKLLFSFHGIPKRFFEQGDPYPCFCRKTARLIAEGLNLGAKDWEIAFQSRFGRAEWLTPYTDETLTSLAKQNLSVAVVCPGFAVDCLETLEEINLQNRAHYQQHGGHDYEYIPALNDSVDQIKLMRALVTPYLSS